MPAWIQDLRFALRSLRRTPTVTVPAVLTLALGLGANAVLFSVADGVLFRPLDFADPARLVHVWPEAHVAKREFRLLQEESRAFEDLGAYYAWASYAFTGFDTPEAVPGAAVTPGFFDTLGVPPLVGRTFRAGEEDPGAAPVVVLSHALWQRRFNADPGLVGRTVEIGGEPWEVIGVMPAGFHFPRRENQMWAPIEFDPDNAVDFGSHYLQVIGRLVPGVDAAAAQAETRALATRMAERFGYAEGFGAARTVEDLRTSMVERVRPALLVLLAAVGFVLLIATVNVANLLLARSAGRRREIAVRVAVGAGRGRLLRLLLGESLMLAVSGGLLGLMVAYWGFDALRALLPADTPRLHEIRLDGRLLAFSAVLTLGAGLLFGLAPALRTVGRALRDPGTGGLGRAAGERERSRLAGALVVAEVAFALLLVAGAGLSLKSFWNLVRVDTGFAIENVLSFRVLSPEDDFERWQAEETALVERLRALPGVTAAGGIQMLPLLNHGFNGGFEVEGRPVDPEGRRPQSNWRVVTPGYFDVLDIPVVEGRGLTGADRAGAPPVALVNRTLAEQMWPGESAVGKRLRHSQENLGRGAGETGDGGPRDWPWVTVVGVVADVHQDALDDPPDPEMYRPHAQNRRPTGLAFVVRTATPPEQAGEMIRAAVAEVIPGAPVSQLRTMDRVLADSVARPRLVMVLLTLFGALALSLGAVGIYGVLAHEVSRRVHEIGVRMALGAERRRVIALVLRRALLRVIVGLGLGLVAALGLARFLGSQLYGVGPLDPGVYAAVTALLLAVALAAAWLPGRRATRVDPMEALRVE